jgi:hypothetical protein
MWLAVTFAEKRREHAMRAKMPATCSRALFLATGALIFSAAAAQADPEAAASPSASPAPAASQFDLPPVGAARAEAGWLRTHLSRVRVHKKTGLAYTTRLERDGSDLELSFRGPGMGRKRLGLSLEVRF